MKEISKKLPHTFTATVRAGAVGRKKEQYLSYKITIPREIAEALKLQPGDVIEVKIPKAICDYDGDGRKEILVME